MIEIQFLSLGNVLYVKAFTCTYWMEYVGSFVFKVFKKVGIKPMEDLGERMVSPVIRERREFHFYSAGGFMEEVVYPINVRHVEHIGGE